MSGKNIYYTSNQIKVDVFEYIKGELLPLRPFYPMPMITYIFYTQNVSNFFFIIKDWNGLHPAWLKKFTGLGHPRIMGKNDHLGLE